AGQIRQDPQVDRAFPAVDRLLLDDLLGGVVAAEPQDDNNDQKLEHVGEARIDKQLIRHDGPVDVGQLLEQAVQLVDFLGHVELGDLLLVALVGFVGHLIEQLKGGPLGFIQNARSQDFFLIGFADKAQQDEQSDDRRLEQQQAEVAGISPQQLGIAG